MPNRQKEKGSRFERDIVDKARMRDLTANRVPLSGSASGFKGDVHIKVGRETWVIEAKKRKSGFKFLYKHLEGSDILVVGEDRNRPLAIIDLEDLLDLLAKRL